MTGNLGTTTLRKRKRAQDPMAAFDALPSPLRLWLAGARLPWSPASARRVWNRARKAGLATDEALDLLTRCEAQTLARSMPAEHPPPRSANRPR